MGTQPRHAYLVCATPRSGSTLLCEMLRETGVAGNPLEHFEVLRHSSLPRQPREYFAGCENSHVLELLAPVEPSHPSTEAPERWWARIVAEGTTANGVWGGKLMWGHVEDFLSRARELPGLADADLAEVLASLLNDPQLIFVTREDKVAQAVSLWRALQTQAWRADNSPNGDGAAYDFDGIDHLALQLQADEDAWRDWFAGTGAGPLTVAYEQLDQAPRQAVAWVLRELGLEEAVAPRPPLARQRNEVSEAWIERYHHERGRVA
jgi:trehalose 2-sulfotransferase